MRVTRLLIVLFAVAVVAAGCAQQQMMGGVQMPIAGAPGIDDVIYGPDAARGGTPAPAPARRGLAGGMFAPAGAAPGVTAAPIAPAAAIAVAYAPTTKEGPYTLDSGDRLRVVVFGQDGLSNAYLIDASGHIDMPLIGSVPARGATTDELSGRIADKLRQGYVREPHVAVEIEAYRPFFILGEVTAPGQYPYVANMTVETAVAIAGGFGPRGFRRQVTISRNVDGHAVRYEVPVIYPIRPGDTIIVEERWF